MLAFFLLLICIDFIFSNPTSFDDAIRIAIFLVVAIAYAIIIFQRLKLTKEFGASRFLVEDKASRQFKESNGCALMVAWIAFFFFASFFLAPKIDLDLPDYSAFLFILVIVYGEFVVLAKEKKRSKASQTKIKGF
ncbi:MAG: hypothetical protein FD163_614 [Hyphomonadaceae bacterium]|nr:MAG: hypothetical protein FD128_1529 [Hyphomonadaceae bacterium]KAF0185946.1 MAG: hypothetical protein FD163_614 [Hyphomonadaceae bacterium]